MKATTIIAIIAGSALLVGGGTMLGLAIAKKGFPLSGSSKKYEHRIDISEEFTKVNIDSSTADIEFKKSDSDKCYIDCVDVEKQYHEAKVNEGVLKVNQVDNRKWYDHLFDFGKRSITVYLTSDTYDEMKIHVSTGDIKCSEFKFGSFEVEASTGNLTLENIEVTNISSFKTSTGNHHVKNLLSNELTIKASTGDISYENVGVSKTLLAETSTGKHKYDHVKAENIELIADTGDVKMNDLVAEQHLSVKTSTGDVIFSDCDASTVNIKTSTGDVKGSFVTGKNFQVKTSTGKVSYPTSSGGLCQVETSTGDVTLEVRS